MSICWFITTYVEQDHINIFVREGVGWGGVGYIRRGNRRSSM
jgi:hypothetical protein